MNLNLPIPTGSPVNASTVTAGNFYWFPLRSTWLLALNFGGIVGNPDQGHDLSLSVNDVNRYQFIWPDGTQISLASNDQVVPPDAGQPTVLDGSYKAKTIYEQ